MKRRGNTLQGESRFVEVESIQKLASMKLIDYINKHYNGNKRQFAIDNNMTAQQVSPMIKKGYYHVIDGYLCIMKTKLKDID